MKAIAATTRQEAVEAELIAGVASGELRQGDLLPSLDRLAERFQVGRQTVALAIARLEARGVLSAQHGKGTWVQNVLDCGDFEVLAKLLSAQAAGTQELAATRQVRTFVWRTLRLVALECQRNFTNESSERLSALVDRLAEMARTSASQERIRSAETSVWQGVATGVANVGVTWLVTAIRPVFVGPVEQSAAHGNVKDALNAYEDLLDALRKDSRKSLGTALRRLERMAASQHEPLPAPALIATVTE